MDSESSPTRRCFIAVPLDEAAAEDLAEFTARLGLPGLRPTPRQNLHLTLKFLGEVEDTRLPALIQGLERAAEGITPFDLQVGGAAILPNARRPRLLAAELDCPEPLSRLHERIQDAMAACGFRREDRAFRPHITLGRFKRPRRRGPKNHPPPHPAPDELDPPATGWRTERIVLMQSDLRAKGPIYTPLAEFSLAT